LTDTPLLGLSTTVTTTVVNDILHALQLQRGDVIIKSLPPDRPNIFIDVSPSSTETVDTALAWLINDIENKQLHCPKTLIFARTINTVSELYTTLMYSLGMYINVYVHVITFTTAHTE